MPPNLNFIVINDDSKDGWKQYKNSIILALIAQLAWDETKKKPDGNTSNQTNADTQHGNTSNQTNADTQETSDDDDDLDADLTLD